MTHLIAGEFRGRRLVSAGDKITRPTMNRTREAVFNILSHNDFDRDFSLPDARVLDVFAGTGAYGFEALSRGASYAMMVEKNPKACRALHQNIESLRTEQRTDVTQSDAVKIGTNPKAPYGLAFFDPPYEYHDMQAVLQCMINQGWIDAETLLVIETHKKAPYEDDALDVVKQSTYGISCVTFGFLSED